jgi:ring-1,2-phenylacetyl-CoA epoxidase subunit PaaC
VSEGAAVPDVAVEELSPEARSALHDLILVLADSKRLLGIRYADWVLGAPELEACIAASSLAQDEWGHARILYALLKGFGEDAGAVEHEREPSEYRNIEALDRPLESWPDFVVANAIIDTALTVQLEALTECCYGALRQRVRKQLEEERFHFGHGAAWLRRLGRADGGAVRSAVQDALDRAWRHAVHWFGPDDFGLALTDAGVAAAMGAGLRERFLARAAPLVERSGLMVPEILLRFEGWDPATRRSNRKGPDADAVARARGDRNRAFLMD